MVMTNEQIKNYLETKLKMVVHNLKGAKTTTQVLHYEAQKDILEDILKSIR